MGFIESLLKIGFLFGTPGHLNGRATPQKVSLLLALQVNPFPASKIIRWLQGERRGAQSNSCSRGIISLTIPVRHPKNGSFRAFASTSPAISFRMEAKP